MKKEEFTIKSLRDELVDSFIKLKNNTMDYKQAKEITNMSGKIIMSSKVELDYNKFMRNKKSIPFLENK